MTAPNRKRWDSHWDYVLGLKLKDHWRWYDRGRTGPGRIELAGQNLQGAAVRGLEGARFESCDFSGSTISLMSDVELVACVFDEAVLSPSTWRRARLQQCRFHGTWLGAANFEDAIIEAGDWLAAYLDGTFWTRARVHDVSFRSAMLTDSRFDDATFVGCDFRYADMSRRMLTSDFARCPNTRFERCDFRGANLEGLRLSDTTFDRCQFYGIVGRPDLEGACALVDPDFSPRGDAGAGEPQVPGIRNADDVLRVWRSEDRAWIHHWALYGDAVAYERQRQYPERQAPDAADRADRVERGE